MFTPPTPRTTIIALTLALWLTTSTLGKAQNVKLQPLTEYETSLRQYHTQKVRTQCIEFQASTKKKWWYYIPQLGINFGLPTINGGTSTFVQLDVQKQQNRVKLASIISQGLLDYRTDLHQLRSLYDALKIDRDALSHFMVTDRIENNILKVAEEANDKKEIKPVDYAEALLRYQRQWIANDRMERDFALKVVEVARFARYQFPTEVLPGLDSLQTVGSVSLSKQSR